MERIAEPGQSSRENAVKVKRARAFGVNLFFATCDECRCWIKSGVGQHVWEQRTQARAAALAHRH
ncbi:hypothetical protein HWC80_gp054 [Mycobacterium phage Indlulamithi]|uniref:Uncharacterized protein n=1 Tax=Mycobacterium phage Indlulamithi TaxID=2656582 RepID=A0A649VCT5_9CAUD|nr:hypothetical protein HWC80_gp054 [Mycobacterium phage Indlulamithi]QGJ90151.1 hypothetical protein PBI_INDLULAMITHI_54 [Mycobacterium phage Indlulamithi]